MSADPASITSHHAPCAAGAELPGVEHPSPSCVGSGSAGSGSGVVHSKPPSVLVHTSPAAQPAVPSAHSSTSAQLVPSPVNPASHAQENEPTSLVHVAFASQESGAAHSSTSAQLVPSYE